MSGQHPVKHLYQELGGYRLRISPALIEGFLAIYGEKDRYPGDTAADRRRDVRMAWARLGLVQTRMGGESSIAISARCDRPEDRCSPVGFLECYERNSEVDSRALPVMMEKLHMALPLFLSRDGKDVVEEP